MYSASRKLTTFCFIFAVINVVGLIMLALLALGANLPFHILFTFGIYAITTTLVVLLITIAVRNFTQDAELEAESTSIQIKKLSDRIADLEKIVK